MRRSLIAILIPFARSLRSRPYFAILFTQIASCGVGHSLPASAHSFYVFGRIGAQPYIRAFPGTLILVNVWATWCAPCKEEMASLNHLALLFENKNIKFVPISIDVSGALTVRSFYERLGLNNLSIYVDPSKNVMDALGITGIPTTIFIGRDGREIGRTVGRANGSPKA